MNLISSRSMRTCDVEDFKTRSDAVFGSMALDLLGRQIDLHQSSLTDVISMVEMVGGTAITVFEREPMTNVLFNKMLTRRRSVQPRGHGNYIPALEEAERLFEDDSTNNTCALMMIFLSDGRPSDLISKRTDLDPKVQALASRFGSRLTIGTVGFGGAEGDFHVLKSMAEAAKAGGAVGLFSYSGQSSSTLSSLISNLGSRLSATRSRMASMTSLAGSRSGLTQRPRRQQTRSPIASSDSSISSDSWWRYGTESKKKSCEWKGKEIGWSDSPICGPDQGSCNVAVRIEEIGRGAERVAYEIQHYTQMPGGPPIPVGEKLVGKESCYVENDASGRDFHLVFCKTQSQVRFLKYGL